MGRTKWLEELRMQKFESVLDRVGSREPSQAMAAEILGLSERGQRAPLAAGLQHIENAVHPPGKRGRAPELMGG